MPSNAIHSLIDKLLFGKDGKEIHKWIDEPSKWLGPNHRDARHNQKSLILLYLLHGDDGLKHGLSHLLIDDILSESYKELKKQITETFGGILQI